MIHIKCSFAPIALFTYERLDTLRETIFALQNNYNALESELFIFSDAEKSHADLGCVKKVREFIKTISGFKSIQIIEAEKHKGLANSIITGVTQIINEYGKVIVLEDDLITSKNCLSFLNQALNYYEANPQIFSIAAFTLPVKGLKSNEIYFTRRASSWGWASWKDRWNNVDWEVTEYHKFLLNKIERKRFNEMGSDLTQMLNRQMQGEINSWAIRWCYHQFRHNLFTVYPSSSKVNNIGFDKKASNTKEKFNRYKPKLDETNNTSFLFSNNLILDKEIIRQFIKPFSIPQRIKYKILNSLPVV